MSRATPFTKAINSILPGGIIWLNLEDESVSAFHSNGKKKSISTRSGIASGGDSGMSNNEKAIQDGHVYDIQALSNLLSRAIKNLDKKRGKGIVIALPVNSSPVQKKLFKQATQNLGWGSKNFINRAQALMTWTSYSSKQDNGFVLYLQNSYCEVVIFEKDKVQKAERFVWGTADWVKKIQQYYLEVRQSLIPTSQIKKILKTFPVSEVLSGSKSRKLSVRAQDQQTKSTVTLSINSQELAEVYEILTKSLSKKMRHSFGNLLGQVSGVVVITTQEINGLGKFIQEEFGWEWGGQSNSGYEVVTGLKIL